MAWVFRGYHEAATEEMAVAVGRRMIYSKERATSPRRKDAPKPAVAADMGCFVTFTTRERSRQGAKIAGDEQTKECRGTARRGCQAMDANVSWLLQVPDFAGCLA